MNKLTVRFSLMAALALLTAMLLAGAAVGIGTFLRADRAISLVYKLGAETQAINDVYKDTTRTRSAMIRAYADAREYGKAASSSSAIDSALASQGRSVKALQAFIVSAPESAADPHLRKELANAAGRLLASLDQAIAALRKDNTADYAAINAKQLTPEGAAFSALLEKFQKQQADMNAQLMAERAEEYRFVVELVGAGVVAALVLVAGVHLFLKRIVIAPIERAIGTLEQIARGDLSMHIEATTENEIGRLMRGIAHMQHALAIMVSKVRGSAHSIEATAREVAGGNADLSARTESQASSLEESAASMEELTATVQQTAENTLQAKHLVETASTAAATSGAVMEKMIDTMSAIDTSSRKVADIIDVIDGIAFQTNILALNAAVEAARAGDQGRGFAVVAAEVRALAHRSAMAAREIKALIDQASGNIQAGGQLAQEAGYTMAHMVDSVRRVAELVREIATASREQSHGIGQVNQAIAQMDEVTQQNAALVEESAAATEAMQDQAVELLKAVGVFKLAPQPRTNTYNPMETTWQQRQIPHDAAS